jgi:carbonic anhydrase
MQLDKLLIFGISLAIGSCTGSTQNQGQSDAFATSDEKSNQKDGYILPGLDHGFEQSPINILSSKNKDDKHHITFYFKDEINKIENLGHTIQLDFKEGSTITQDDTTFNFKQCHFHTPSEHLIDGITYPMEMHIVNLMDEKDGQTIPQYLVVGVLFKLGEENKFIAEFLNSIPNAENENKELEAGTVKLTDLFGDLEKEINGQYYHYKGSLTTPPYTESVRWYILKHIFEASAEQIEAINKVEGNNARHVQAVYGRTVTTK